MFIRAIDLYEDGNYKPVDSEDLFFTLSKKEVSRLRVRINQSRARDKTELIRCSLCKEPLYISASPFSQEKSYHLSHRRTEDEALRKCPQRSKSSVPIDVLRSLKYKGATESKEHHDLKYLISELLKADPNIDSGSVLVESRLVESGEWRRPDVQANVEGYTTAFEVQVSTEMAPVIAAREYFYEKFGRILWILPRFCPEKINQSQIDISVSNHDHLFVLDNEMSELSLSKGELHLRCWVHMPSLEAGALIYRWVDSVVALTQIKFRNGHAYVIDTLEIESDLKSKIEQANSVNTATDQPKLSSASKAVIKSSNYLYSASEQEIRLWVKWKRICDFVLEPLVVKKLVKLLPDEYGCGPQTSRLSGILLRLHGIDWNRLECSDTTIKLISSAASKQLYWKHQTWLWATNLLCREFPQWIGPYHRLLKGSDVLHELKRSGAVREAFKVARKRSGDQVLGEQEKALLGLIAPQLDMQTPSLPLLDFEQYGFGYVIEFRNRTPEHLVNVVSPDFPLYTASAHREEASTELLRREIHGSILKCREPSWLPMPNLPSKVDGTVQLLPIGNDFRQSWLSRMEKQIVVLTRQAEAL